MMRVDGKALDAVQEHAEDQFPNESCGAIFYGGGSWPEYVPMYNVAADPRRAFAIDHKALDFERRLRHWCRYGIVHSHPHPWAACPSEADMRQQIAMDVPWGIVPVGEDGAAGDPFFWGPDVERPPLLGRPYRLGVTDCFSLVRDWYLTERGIDLPDVPRGPGWHARPDDLIERSWPELGGVEVHPAEAQAGDVLLMQITRAEIAQIAVIVESGVILIHPGADKPYDPQRLSKREPIGRWQPYIRRVLRKQTDA